MKQHHTPHSITHKGPRLTLRLWLTLVFLSIGGSALAVADAHDVPEFRSSFSNMRDPMSLRDTLAVDIPRSLIPLTVEDAIAEVFFADSKTLNEREAQSLAEVLCDEAQDAGYDPLFVLALMRIESNYNHLATSPVGAEGLMQVMPYTAQWLADRHDMKWEQHSFDPIMNVRLGTRYLGHLRQEFNGRKDLVLTAYNRGPRATRYLVRHNGHLPKEIRDFYATKVFKKYRELRRKYGRLPETL